MKRLMIFMLAIFMVIGIGTAANAAPVLMTGLDFYGGDTSYTQGDIDTYVELNLGDTVMVDFVYEITDPVDPLAFGLWKAGFELDFNPAMLSASNYTEVPLWTSYPGSDSGISAGNVKFSGQEQAFMNSLSGTIITFQLTCLAVGSDDILFSDWDDGHYDWYLSILEDPNAESPLDDIVNFGTIATVNNVPIPGAVWLLGSGLIGLVGLRRRRS